MSKSWQDEGCYGENVLSRGKDMCKGGRETGTSEEL